MSGLGYIGRALGEGSAGLRRAAERQRQEALEDAKEGRAAEAHTASMESTRVATEGQRLRNQSDQAKLDEWNADAANRDKARDVRSSELDVQKDRAEWDLKHGDTVRDTELETARLNQTSARLRQKLLEMENELKSAGHGDNVSAAALGARRQLSDQLAQTHHEMGRMVMGAFKQGGGPAAARLWNSMEPNMEEGARPAANIVVDKDESGNEVYRVVDEDGDVVMRRGLPQVFSKTDADIYFSAYSDGKGNHWLPNPEDPTEEVLTTFAGGSFMPVVDWRTGEPVKKASGKVSVPGIGAISNDKLLEQYEQWKKAEYGENALDAPAADAFLAFGIRARAVIDQGRQELAKMGHVDLSASMITPMLVQLAGQVPETPGDWMPRYSPKAQRVVWAKPGEGGKWVVADYEAAPEAATQAQPAPAGDTPAPAGDTPAPAGGEQAAAPAAPVAGPQPGKALRNEQALRDRTAEMDAALAAGAEGAEPAEPVRGGGLVNRGLRQRQKAEDATEPAPNTLPFEDFSKVTIDSSDKAEPVLQSWNEITKGASMGDMPKEKAVDIVRWWELNSKALRPAARQFFRSKGQNPRAAQVIKESEALYERAKFILDSQRVSG